MRFKFIKSPKKRKILKEIDIPELPGQLIETPSGKIYVFSGNLAKEDIFELNRITNIESIGLHILTKEKGEYSKT